MAEPLQIEDDGIMAVQVKGADKPVSFDLYRVHDRLVSAHNLLQAASEEEYFGAVEAVMAEVGLPTGSWRLARNFQKAVFDAVADLKKKDTGSTTPALPASTGPEL